MKTVFNLVNTGFNVQALALILRKSFLIWYETGFNLLKLAFILRNLFLIRIKLVWTCWNSVWYWEQVLVCGNWFRSCPPSPHSIPFLHICNFDMFFFYFFLVESKIIFPKDFSIFMHFHNPPPLPQLNIDYIFYAISYCFFGN